MQILPTLLDEYFLNVTAKYQQSVRDIVALAIQAGVPVPTFSAAITYFDSYRSARSSRKNLIKHNVTTFWVHTYQRKDKKVPSAIGTTKIILPYGQTEFY